MTAPELQDADAAQVLEGMEPGQFPPPRTFDVPQAPSVLEALRACRPSRELLGLLLRELQAHLDAGKVDDAAALFALAMCVREVLE